MLCRARGRKRTGQKSSPETFIFFSYYSGTLTRRKAIGSVHPSPHPMPPSEFLRQREARPWLVFGKPCQVIDTSMEGMSKELAAHEGGL